MPFLYPQQPMFACKQKSPHFKKSVTMDYSNGYEGIAPFFIKTRGQALNGIGTSSVLNWARTLPMKATVLDIGCGRGIPISKILMDEGMRVYGIDASPTMIKALQGNFPTTAVACEYIEDSCFFNGTFDPIIAWGVFFLLSQTAQAKQIRKVAAALPQGGKLLFTSPRMPVEWMDAMAGQRSVPLGADKYKVLLAIWGFLYWKSLWMRVKIITIAQSKHISNKL